jgi:hypothetical protein
MGKKADVFLRKKCCERHGKIVDPMGYLINGHIG